MMIGIQPWPSTEPKDPSKSYTAVYSPTHKVENVTQHPQVDTGLGFSCDEKIIDVVVALNRGPLKTGGTCQGPVEPWALPRAYLTVSAKDKDPYTLLRCLLFFKERIDQEGYSCEMRVDDYLIDRDTNEHVTTAGIQIVYRLLPRLTTLANQLCEDNNA